MNFITGTLVKARNREWVVLSDSTEDFLLLRPLGGTDHEVSKWWLRYFVFKALLKCKPFIVGGKGGYQGGTGHEDQSHACNRNPLSHDKANQHRC